MTKHTKKSKERKVNVLFNMVREAFFGQMLRAIPPQDLSKIKFRAASKEEVERARRLGKIYKGIDYGYKKETP